MEIVLGKPFKTLVIREMTRGRPELKLQQWGRVGEMVRSGKKGR